MSQAEDLPAGSKRPALIPIPGAKASGVQFDQVGGRISALLLAILNRAGLRADYSSFQRFEFLEVPALASRARSARLANS